MSISKINSSVSLDLLYLLYESKYAIVTATGDEQTPIQNIIGKSIVEACVRAGKEGRKFRVIIIIPAIPGFAGDLREDGAIGTRFEDPTIIYELKEELTIVRAIMDYQYKSILRGEHSIHGQIKAQGVDPTGTIV